MPRIAPVALAVALAAGLTACGQESDVAPGGPASAAPTSTGAAPSPTSAGPTSTSGVPAPGTSTAPTSAAPTPKVTSALPPEGFKNIMGEVAAATPTSITLVGWDQTWQVDKDARWVPSDASGTALATRAWTAAAAGGLPTSGHGEKRPWVRLDVTSSGIVTRVVEITH